MTVEEAKRRISEMKAAPNLAIHTTICEKIDRAYRCNREDETTPLNTLDFRNIAACIAEKMCIIKNCDELDQKFIEQELIELACFCISTAVEVRVAQKNK